MKTIGNKLVIIILILFISIGFAYLSTRLDLNGITYVSKQSWDIHFETPTKVGGNVDAINLELTDDTTVEFSVNLLKPRDSYEFTVDVVNDGSIDAMIDSITATELNTNQKKLFEYVITYDDGAALKEKQKLAHESSDKFKVTVRYKDDISDTDLSLQDQTINITISVKYVQADNTSFNRITNSFIKVYNQTTPGVLVQGDEVNIGNEHFYIFNKSADKYVLLSKYNLNVGYNKNLNVTEGIQDKSITGYKPNATFFGNVAFSYGNYWYDENTNELKSKYGIYASGSNIYDSEYNEATGTKYSIAYYVTAYVDKLELLGATNINGRLLTLYEVTNFGCDLSSNSCINVSEEKKFIYSTSYFLASTWLSFSTVWHIDSTGSLDNYYYYFDGWRGVRPAIEVMKQYL